MSLSKISTISPGLAPEYNPSSTYDVGEYVLYLNSYWRCIRAIVEPEPWTQEHWELDYCFPKKLTQLTRLENGYRLGPSNGENASKILASEAEAEALRSDKANKSEMSVTPGTGDNADKTTIQLKTGTSATVLTTHQDISDKADLVDGVVPASQLPSYVDDVVEYDAKSIDDVTTVFRSDRPYPAGAIVKHGSPAQAYVFTEAHPAGPWTGEDVRDAELFPAPGEKSKIYLALNTDTQYRWSGSTYIEMAKYVAPYGSNPEMAGMASPGTADAYSRGDHVHPTDTTRASVADATLTDAATWACNPATDSNGQAYHVEWQDRGWATAWFLYAGDDQTPVSSSYSTDASATRIEFTVASGVVVATRAALQGYQLGNQDDKPLASEAEAEALRDGKLDKSGGIVNGDMVVSGGLDVIGDFLSKICMFNIYGEPVVGGRFIVPGATNNHYATFAFKDATFGLFTRNGRADAGTFYALQGATGTLALTAGTGHTGNLATLDSQGNPTDSGKKPSDFQSALTAQQLANIAAVSDALAFDATHSYAAGDPAVYNGTLYTFTTAHTGAWTGSDVSAVDIIARLASKANDNAVVKLTGDQTIADAKTFTGVVKVRGDTGLSVEDLSVGAMVQFKQRGIEVYPADGPSYVLQYPATAGVLALTAGPNHAGNLAALDAQGNPTDSGLSKDDVESLFFAVSESLLDIPLGNYADMDSIADRLDSVIRALKGIYGPDDRTLYFRSLQDGSTVAMQKINFAPSVSLEYSVDDGVNWSPFVVGETTVTINRGKWVRIRAASGATQTQFAISTSNYNRFLLGGSVAVGGNSMSLFYHEYVDIAAAIAFPNVNITYILAKLFSGNAALKDASALILPATTLAESCYSYMFSGCSSLSAAPELPATALAWSCYRSMFSNCASLSVAPELPATALVDFCYTDMFYGCTSLSTAPELPATALARSCYNGMFSGCTSLSAAPELPVPMLAPYCYGNMFSNCTSLISAPELPATTLIERCYVNMFSGCMSLDNVSADFGEWSNATTNWLNGVSATGEFHCKPDLDISTTGASTIPSGWTVVRDR